MGKFVYVKAEMNKCKEFLLEITGSIEEQCRTRIENLYKESNTWLLKAAYNITKNREESEDLVQDVFEWLWKKQNPKLFYQNSFNLLYIHKFLQHRWINKTKKLNRFSYVGQIYHEDAVDEYDTELDLDVMKAYDEVMQEIQRLKRTKNFASAMIYEIYWGSEDTLQEVADKIGISKSTTFISIKKVRKHLKEVIKNPFDV